MVESGKELTADLCCMICLLLLETNCVTGCSRHVRRYEMQLGLSQLRNDYLMEAFDRLPEICVSSGGPKQLLLITFYAHFKVAV